MFKICLKCLKSVQKLFKIFNICSTYSKTVQNVQITQKSIYLHELKSYNSKMLLKVHKNSSKYYAMFKMSYPPKESQNNVNIYQNKNELHVSNALTDVQLV